MHTLPLRAKGTAASFFLAVCWCWAACGHAVPPLTATLHAPPPAAILLFNEANRSPAGDTIAVTSRSLLLNGKPWFPVMGEFHFSRCPDSAWKKELAKMKAGGVEIVSTYIFWNHHEEIEGSWDWSGWRNLGKFVATCRDLGLKVVLRCGPYCNGDSRHGGFPDWVFTKPWDFPPHMSQRSSHPDFLAAVRRLYAEIGAQVRGQMWKDGGPVVAVQVDNEFAGPAEWLLTLKAWAKESGLEAPLYTVTDWIPLATPLPEGEFLPLGGVYPDLFWDTNMKPGGGYESNFRFQRRRTSYDMGQVGGAPAGDAASAAAVVTGKLPYLSCEQGGGMLSAYHRRPLIDPKDIASLAVVQIGSGLSGLGYYMYHDGQNPPGKQVTFNKTHLTDDWDLPVTPYEFGGPIGPYGQIRPHYRWLRRLHMFLADFGGPLAAMPAFLPEEGRVRWAVRSDGHSGYLFINNYQRLTPMAAQENVQFQLELPGGRCTVPAEPMMVPKDAFMILPFHLPLRDARLIYATAQLVCKTSDPDGETVYFAEIPGVDAEFLFDAETLEHGTSSAPRHQRVKPGREPAFAVRSKSGALVRAVLVSEEDSLCLVKHDRDGRETVVFEQPQPDVSHPVAVEQVRKPAGLRAVPLDTRKNPPSPIGPTDQDFEHAGIWRLRIPDSSALGDDSLLRIRYVGDVARLKRGGTLLAEHYYSGRPFEFGLSSGPTGQESGELTLEILPLQKDVPIYLDAVARPDFGMDESVLKLDAVEVISVAPR